MCDYLTFYKENGFLGPFKLYEPEEMERLWNKTRIKLLNLESSIYPGSKINYDRHLDVHEIENIVLSNEITDKIKTIIGENIKCWRTEWFPKYPGDEGTEWHQVEGFFEFEGGAKVTPTEESPEIWGCSVWVAMTDATIENGCLRVIPGSNKEYYFDESKMIDYEPDLINSRTVDNEKKGFFGYDWGKLKKDPNWKPDLEKAKNIVMEAGEFFIFSSQVLHGSLPNSSEKDTRIGMSIRYVSDDVKVYPDIKSFKFKGETLFLDKYKTLKV